VTTNDELIEEDDSIDNTSDRLKNVAASNTTFSTMDSLMPHSYLKDSILLTSLPNSTPMTEHASVSSNSDSKKHISSESLNTVQSKARFIVIPASTQKQFNSRNVKLNIKN
jgi:hypothetical protein